MEAEGVSVINLEDRIEQAWKSAETAFYRLILVIGAPNAGKTKALTRFGQRLQSPVVNLNLTLSRYLLELSRDERSLSASAVLADLGEEKGGTLIFDNTEILFDRALALDPLRLLQGLSRTQVVLASWVGAMSQERLIYAAPGHPEHRVYKNVEAVTIDLSQGDRAE